MKQLFQILLIFVLNASAFAQSSQVEKEISIEADHFEILGMNGGRYLGLSETESIATIYAIGSKNLRIQWQVQLEKEQKINKEKIYYQGAAKINSNVFVIYAGIKKDGISIYKSEINAEGEISPLEVYTSIPCYSLNNLDIKILKSDSTTALRIFNTAHSNKKGKFFLYVVNMQTYQFGKPLTEFDLSQGYKSGYTIQESISNTGVYAILLHKSSSLSNENELVLHSISLNSSEINTRIIETDWLFSGINISYDHSLKKIAIAGLYGGRTSTTNYNLVIQGFFVMHLNDSITSQTTSTFSLKDGLGKFTEPYKSDLGSGIANSGGTWYVFQECISVGANKAYYIFEDDRTFLPGPRNPYISWFRRMLVLEFYAGKLINTHYLPKNIYANGLIKEQEKGYFTYARNNNFHVVFPLSYTQKKYLEFDYGISNPAKDAIYLLDVEITNRDSLSYNVLQMVNENMRSYAAQISKPISPYQGIYMSEQGILFNKIRFGNCYLLLVPPKN